MFAINTPHATIAEYYHNALLLSRGLPSGFTNIFEGTIILAEEQKSSDMDDKMGFETSTKIAEELRELRAEIRARLNGAERQLSALKDLLSFIIADRIAEWPLQVRLAIIPRMVNLGTITEGIRNIVSRQNPLSPSELQRLELYTQRAQIGQPFSPEEAIDFRQLSERVAQEHTDQAWVSELLKLALIIAAIYALCQLFRTDTGDGQR
jgi:hypothetical protein